MLWNRAVSSVRVRDLITIPNLPNSTAGCWNIHLTIRKCVECWFDVALNTYMFQLYFLDFQHPIRVACSGPGAMGTPCNGAVSMCVRLYHPTHKEWREQAVENEKVRLIDLEKRLGPASVAACSAEAVLIVQTATAKADQTRLAEDKEDEDWASVRSTLDMPFPNLPYLIDTSGDSPIRLSQSNAILRYLARGYDFYGDSESDRIEIDVLQDEAYDFRNEIIATAYTLGEDYAAKFEHFSTDTLPHYLDSFETCLAGLIGRKYAGLNNGGVGYYFCRMVEAPPYDSKTEEDKATE